MQSYARSCVVQNSVDNLVKLLLIAPGGTWEHLDNVQHQLCSVGSFMIETEFASGIQTAVALIPLCGHSFKSLLFSERCSIRSTVNNCSILGVKLRLLKEDPSLVLEAKSRKVGSLGLPDLGFAGSLRRAGLRTGC